MLCICMYIYVKHIQHSIVIMSTFKNICIFVCQHFLLCSDHNQRVWYTDGISIHIIMIGDNGNFLDVFDVFKIHYCSHFEI